MDDLYAIGNLRTEIERRKWYRWESKIQNQGSGGWARHDRKKKAGVDAMAQVIEVQKHWSEGWRRKSKEEMWRSGNTRTFTEQKPSASQGHLNQLRPDTLTHLHILKTSTNIFNQHLHFKKIIFPCLKQQLIKAIF